MKLSLIKVKHSEFASQETNCFEAVVCIDGKSVAIASNQGCGGPTDLNDIVRGSVAKIEAYAKSLPVEKCEWGNMPQTGESLVDDLLTEHLILKDMKKSLKKITMLDGGQIYTFKNKPGVENSLRYADIQKRYPKVSFSTS